MPAGMRLNEIAGSLSLATDLAAGMSNEGALRTSVAATLLGRAAGLGDLTLSDVHYVALFRNLGCSGYAHEEAFVGAGNDHRMLGALEIADAGRPATVLRAALTRLARDEGFAARARAVARFLSDPKGYSSFARAHCDQAVALARTLGLRPSIVASKRGDAVALAARITSIACVVEVQQHVRHIYEKTRVGTRAAAALDATEHDLVARFADVPSGERRG